MFVVFIIALAISMAAAAVIVDAHQGVPLRNAYHPFSVETSIKDK